MNIEEVFEQWSDIESESDESDSSSESEEEDIGNEIESDEQSWREALCISIVCFTSGNITKKHNHDKHHYNKLYADYSLRTSRRITSSLSLHLLGLQYHC